MKEQRKLNKLKVSIVIIIFVLAFTISVFGRYLYNAAREAYFTVGQFYFSSDILTLAGAHYQYSNWDGEVSYPIEFELYSYMNDISRLDYDLDYTVTCTTEDSDKVKCTVNSNASGATNTGTGTIYATSNVSTVVVFVTPITTINEGESVTVTVTASTSVPYEKSISCEFTLKVENQATTIYSIDDAVGNEYALFELTNSSNSRIEYTLEFDPRELRLDMNDEIYINRKSV